MKVRRPRTRSGRKAQGCAVVRRKLTSFRRVSIEPHLEVERLGWVYGVDEREHRVGLAPSGSRRWE